MNQHKRGLLALCLALLLALTGCEQVMERTSAMVKGIPGEMAAQTEAQQPDPEETQKAQQAQKSQEQSQETAQGERFVLDLVQLPPYCGEPWVEVNGNQPCFEDTTTTQAFETYSGLDRLGRCGAAFANVCPELMPVEERGAIGAVKPSGWQSMKYDFIDGKFLYNRCHLIGYQLTGENSNVCNLITGTRSLNVEGMLPFENQVADYVRQTGNHVLYRATPVFSGEELVARGVELEAWSVEDRGEGVCFHVWCYNAQPGVSIDYATGESVLTAQLEEEKRTGYVLNVAKKKFHLPDCKSVEQMSPKNRKSTRSTREALIQKGWEPCGRCKP